MKIFTLIWRSVTHALAYTTLFALCIYIINAISDPERNAIIASQFLLLMLFGFICGFAQELFRLRRLPLAARIGIHYGTLLLSFMIVCLLSDKLGSDFGQIVIFAIVFSIAYAIVVTVILVSLRLSGIYDKQYSYQTGNEDNSEVYEERFR